MAKDQGENQDLRCPWAIGYGVTLHTRCHKSAGHPGNHQGAGLSDYPYQRVEWSPEDHREYRSGRTDTYSWQQ